MGAAFRAVGVDRNTIVVNAPMAELCIAAPETFAELRDRCSKKEKLSCFTQRYIDAIEGDVSIITKMKAFKDSGKLLPINKGK